MRQLWLAIYLPSLLIATGQQAVVIMLPLFAFALVGGDATRTDAAAAATLAATLMALRGTGSLCANVPAGLLVSRFGDRAVMLGGLGMLAAAALLLGASALLRPAGVPTGTTVLFASVAATLFGAASGAWFLARLAFVAEAAPPAWRGRALAGLGGVQRVGLLLGPVAGGVLVHEFGFGAAFATAGACIALAFALVVPFTHAANVPPAASALPAADVPPTGNVPPAPGLHSVLAVLRDYRRVFATAGVAVTTLAVLRAGRQLLIPLWGTLLGLDPRQVGVTFMISSAVEIAMAWPGGWLVDRRGHKWAALPCFALLCASVALLPWATDWPSLVAVAVLAGIGNGFGSGIMMTFGAGYAPPARRGEFLGVWRMMGDAGQVAGPTLIGAIAAAFSLAAATWGAAAIGLAGMALMAFVVQVPEEGRDDGAGRRAT
jgi:MFS family permease